MIAECCKAEKGHDLLEVSMGPHHPSTHGVFRMDVVLDGETVVKLKPVFGYLHRNHEKIAEKNSYLASIPYTDRLDYICSMTNNWAYVLTVEKLSGISVPERSEYIGRARHAADVCVPRARKNTGPFRGPDRFAHDVQLHALWRVSL